MGWNGDDVEVVRLVVWYRDGKGVEWRRCGGGTVGSVVQRW